MFNTAKFFIFLIFLFITSTAKADDLVVVYGDSLTAGYNLPDDASFPNQLQDWLQSNDWVGDVINASQSGDTTAVGLARFEWAMASWPKKPDLFILELGANDMLRAIEPSVARANLDALLAKLAAQDISVLLVGMQATPTYGAEWAEEFNSIYPDLAKKYQIPLYPFFLDGVALIPELNLSDGMHPNREGVAIIVNRVGPLILDLLEGPSE